MKNWRINVEGTPKETITKLHSHMSSDNGFVLRLDKKADQPISFRLRKRIQDGEKILHHNLIIAEGTISPTENDNYSTVAILFKQNTFVTLTKFILIGLAGFAIIAGIFNDAIMLIPGIIFSIIIIASWMWYHKKFEENINNYKIFFSGIFDNKSMQGS